MGLKQKMTNWFFIENSSGLVLDIAGGKQGGELQIYTKHGGDNQLWSRDEEGRLVSKTGLACDIEGGQKKEGTKVIGWSQHEGQNQKWKLSGNHIYSLLNNLVLDVNGGKTSSGSKVHMWPWHGGINQRWYITPLKQKMTNWFFIENSSGLVLDIAGGKQGGELQIYTKHGGDNQLWSRDEEGRLVSKTGLACDIEGG